MPNMNKSTRALSFSNANGAKTMSSREIADLCETRHNQVVETIERLFEKGVLRESRKTTRTHQPEGGGRPTEVYDLTRRDTLVVVSAYDDEVRARIIDRWEELERAALEAPNPVSLSKSAREARLFFRQAMSIAKIAGLNGNQMLISANRSTRAAVGFDHLAEMGIRYLEAPDNDVLLTATDLGKALGAISAIRVNHLLAEHGFQTGEKDGKGRSYWLPTEKGVSAGGKMVEVERSNKSGQARQLRWPSHMTDTLRQLIEAA